MIEAMEVINVAGINETNNTHAIENLLRNLTEIPDGLLGNRSAIFPSNLQGSKKSIDLIIEEESEEDEDDFPLPHQCQVCGEETDDLYSWYHLKHETDPDKSVAICSISCLDTFHSDHDTDDYIIIEHNRCSTYFECEEIGNLRRMCERTENKSHKNLSVTLSKNFCDPAQAGIILATHKLKDVLTDFSGQTEKQYLANKEMMEQSAKESAKQFKITTWMTALVIILTIANLVSVFLIK